MLPQMEKKCIHILIEKVKTFLYNVIQELVQLLQVKNYLIKPNRFIKLNKNYMSRSPSPPCCNYVGENFKTKQSLT